MVEYLNLMQVTSYNKLGKIIPNPVKIFFLWAKTYYELKRFRFNFENLNLKPYSLSSRLSRTSQWVCQLYMQVVECQGRGAEFTNGAMTAYGGRGENKRWQIMITDLMHTSAQFESIAITRQVKRVKFNLASRMNPKIDEKLIFISFVDFCPLRLD